MKGNQSGELDVVVEYPFLPSLTLAGHSRLYLAEGVAAAIEVKSNIATQWKEAISTGEKLKKLTRDFGSTMSVGKVYEEIPFFVVGYTGWKDMKTLEVNSNSSPVDGILVIDSGLFYFKEGATATGDLSLWGLIAALSHVSTSLKSSSPNPFAYFG